MPGKKKNTIYRKKRKRVFSGKRKQEQEHESNSEDLGPASSSSPEKLNRSFEKIDNNCPLLEVEREETITRAKGFQLGINKSTPTTSSAKEGHNSSQYIKAYGNKLVTIENLQNILTTAAVCASCRSAKGKLELFQNDLARKGLDEELLLLCTNCQNSSIFHSSIYVKDGGRRSEVNIRLIQGGLETGNGHTSLKKLCSLLNLPPPVSKNAYSDTINKIEQCYSTVVEKSLEKAAKNLKRALKKMSPSHEDLDIEDDVFPVTVSVDGTWQKRYGHSSLLGVVFVLAVETGEVLDLEVKSKICFECRSKGNWDKDSQRYKDWFAKHQDKCCINHNKSSEAMEKSAAVTMFLRSIEKHKLKYVTYVGDGDSSSFGEVADACFKKYGSDYLVTKEDCIGHIQKRMGSNLRMYKNKMKASKLPDGVSVGGRGRLTDVAIDSLQNYYGYAIRSNKGNLKMTQDAVWAIYFHSIVGENEALEIQHRFCPKGSLSWCKWQQDQLNKTKTYNRNKCLPAVFRSELKPIFERLSKEDLLKRCLKGLTQNQNESLNNVLWSKCPKRVFCGKRKLDAAAAASVIQWNQGAAGAGCVLEEMGIEHFGVHTARGFRALNDTRIKNAGNQSRSSYLNRRRLLRKAKKMGTKAGRHYMSGGFSTHKVPDVILKKDREEPKEPQITFVAEENIDVMFTSEPPRKRLR